MSSAPKILITGASGFLGYHLLRVAHRQGYQLYGQYHAHPFAHPQAVALQLDLRNYIDMGNLIDDIEPDIVIHTAALADSHACQNDPQLSFDINVDATRNLAGICSDYQIPFVFTSSDLVFDGLKGSYSEDESPNPQMVYGRHKLEAEQEVLRVYPDSLIVRCPLMFGAEAASSKNYFSQFLKGMREGKTANLFNDEYRSVCGAGSIAEGIMHLCQEVSGIVHLAGPERVSRYDFGLAIATIWGFDRGLLRSLSQRDIQMSAPRPADVSLDITKALSLGYAPLGYKAELRDIAEGKYL